MTGEELHEIGTRVWGHGYQKRIAAGLGVDVRTVRRWTKGESRIPAGAETEIRALVAAEEEAARLEGEAYAYAAPRVDAILAGCSLPLIDVLKGIVMRASETMRDDVGLADAARALRGALKVIQAEDVA